MDVNKKNNLEIRCRNGQVIMASSMEVKSEDSPICMIIFANGVRSYKQRQEIESVEVVDEETKR